MFTIMYFLVLLMQFFLFTFHWTELAKPRLSFSWTFALLCGGQMLLHLIFYFFTGSINNTVPASVLSTVLTYVTVYFSFEGKPSIRIRLILTNAIIVVIGEVLTFVLTCWIFRIKPAEILITSSYQSAGQLISDDLLLIAVGASIMFMNRKKENFRKVQRFVAIIPSYGLLHLVYLVVFYRYNIDKLNHFDLFLQILLQMMLTYLLVGFYWMVKRGQKKQETEEIFQQIDQSMQATHKYYTLAHDKFEEISRIRHDFRNQLQTVEHLIAEGQLSEAQESVQLIENALEETRLPQFCPNPVVDVLLTLKLNEPENKGVRTEVLVRDIELLPLNQYELCSLLSNMIDNAFVSVNDSGAPMHERLVTIRSRCVNKMLLIKVTNTCHPDATVDNPPPRSGHGYGLQIVRRITRRYNGTFQLTKEGTTVTAIAAIPAEGTSRSLCPGGKADAD